MTETESEKCSYSLQYTWKASLKTYTVSVCDKYYEAEYTAVCSQYQLETLNLQAVDGVYTSIVNEDINNL